MKKAGSSLYWDDWSKDIATIAGRYIRLIEQLLEDPEHQDAFQEFVVALRQTLNPSVVNASAVEMLAQHILAAPLFDAMFPDHSFSKQNLVSRAMNTILENHRSFNDRQRAPRAGFLLPGDDRAHRGRAHAGGQTGDHAHTLRSLPLAGLPTHERAPGHRLHARRGRGLHHPQRG